MGHRAGERPGRVETLAGPQGEALCHVVYLEPGGFVVVAADDQVEPVIAFSSGGRMDPSAENPLWSLLKGDLPGRVAAARDRTARGQGPGRDRAKWQALAAEAESPLAGSPEVTEARVSPLIGSRWDQEQAGGQAVYNYYTPPNAAGAVNNYPCGCVATAGAQVMRFFQFPTVGVGTGSFTITVDNTSTTARLRGGDGLGGAYRWADMPLVPSSPTDAQRQAIGALTWDAGIVSQMKYTASGSSAYLATWKKCLLSSFRYANAVDGQNAGYNLGSALTNMINPNLDAGRPVVLGIVGSPGGHAVVCDGYGYSVSTLYYHLNLGWSGVNDAWYALPVIDTVIGSFTNVQECVYNISTNGTGEILSGRVVDTAGAPVAGAAVTARRKGGTYTTTTDSKGIYAFANLPSSSTYTNSVVKTGYVVTNAIFRTGASVDRFASSGNLWGANFVLRPAPPTNDLCAGSIVLAGTALTNRQSTLGATATGDPTPPAQSSFGAGVWFRYTPAFAGQLVVDTTGSGFDTVVGIYTGSCGSMTVQASDDNSAGGTDARAVLQAAAGVPYSILAGGRGGATGDLVLRLALNGPALLSVQASPLQGGSVAGGGTYLPGAQQQISATPAAGWLFRQWQDGVTINPRDIVMPAGGALYTAGFAPVPVLRSAAWSPAGATLWLEASAGQASRVEASTNLVDWTLLAVVTNVTSTLELIDPAAATLPCRFYRVAP